MQFASFNGPGTAAMGSEDGGLFQLALLDELAQFAAGTAGVYGRNDAGFKVGQQASWTLLKARRTRSNL